MKLQQIFAAIALTVGLAIAPVRSQAAVFVDIRVAPPVIPVYEQPICPGPDYLWTPGYWAWDAEVADYYWVPGTWVMAPQVGYLWTPGYWGFNNGLYAWNAGYWGPHIGFYGGVNYGFGYFGTGFEGGYWGGGHFFYNTTILHVNTVNIHNTYVHNVTVVNNSRVAFNGGPGGIAVRPGPGEMAAIHENHVEATHMQAQHADFARQDRSQFAGANHGQPPAAAMAHPAESANAFHGGNVTPGHAGPAGGAQGFNGGAQHPETQNRPAPAAQPRPQSYGGPQSHPAPAPHPAASHPAGHH